MKSTLTGLLLVAAMALPWTVPTGAENQCPPAGKTIEQSSGAPAKQVLDTEKGGSDRITEPAVKSRLATESSKTYKAEERLEPSARRDLIQAPKVRSFSTPERMQLKDLDKGDTLNSRQFKPSRFRSTDPGKIWR